MPEFAQIAAQPVELDRAGQAQPELGARVRVIAPRVRREQILPLVIESCQPGFLVGPHQRLDGRLGQVDEVVEMAGPRRPRLARFVEPLPSVLANGLEQAITLRAGFQRNERLLHQVRQQVEHVRVVDIAARAHCFGGVQRDSPREHGEPAQ
jgi:hypothetical protein